MSHLLTTFYNVGSKRVKATDESTCVLLEKMYKLLSRVSVVAMISFLPFHMILTTVSFLL